jgi:hypothetical protein
MWYNPKYKCLYFSSYDRGSKRHDRVFTLTPETGKGRIISFESWQQAKKQGWIKVPKEWSYASDHARK